MPQGVTYHDYPTAIKRKLKYDMLKLLIQMIVSMMVPYNQIHELQVKILN